MPSGGIFDCEQKKRRLLEVSRELEDPLIWQQPEKAQILGQERARLQEAVHGLTELKQRLTDGREMQEFINSEPDPALFSELCVEVLDIDQQVAVLEFQRMFSGRSDSSNAFLYIQS